MNISAESCGGEACRAGISAFGLMATRVVPLSVDPEIVYLRAEPLGMP
jgi:hypothetical protein